MTTDLSKSMNIAAAGMRVQGTRIRVVAENMANANSTAATPEQDPYRRKMVTFKSEFDRTKGVNLVRASGVAFDHSPFERKHDPGNPAADADGFVRLPNVNTLIEAVDMREAQRSYEANLAMLDMIKNMLSSTVDMLRR